MNEWKLGKLQKKNNQNLTRCKIFNSKSDALFFLQFKIWRVVFFFEFKIWRLVFFQFKIWHVMDFSIENHVFLKSTKNAKCVISSSKMGHNVIFWMQTFFKNPPCRKNFNSKSNALYFFSIQKLRRCKAFETKSDAFWKFCFKICRVREIQLKIWKVSKRFVRNMTFIFLFSFWLIDDIFSPC